MIAQPLNGAGVPVFGALGGQDLSHSQVCNPDFTPGPYATCVNAHQTKTGASLQWRQAFAGMPAPWGTPGSAAPASRALRARRTSPAAARGPEKAYLTAGQR